MTTQPARWCLLITLVVVLATPAATHAGATTEVTYCGQTYFGHGILTGNLDCTGFGGVGVTIVRGRLELNGFNITNAGQYGVHCESTCQILGPGTISGNGLDGVRTEGWVAVRDARVLNNALDGINARNYSTAGRAVVSDSLISGNGFNGVEADSSVILRRSTVSGNDENGVDVGVYECNTTGRLVLFLSTVSGNGTVCSESDVCADLSACGRNQRAPQLKRISACQTSYVKQSGFPGQTWGVCSQD